MDNILVAAPKKAMFAMRQRYALMGIKDPAMQRRLFDTVAVAYLELHLSPIPSITFPIPPLQTLFSTENPFCAQKHLTLCAE